MLWRGFVFFFSSDIWTLLLPFLTLSWAILSMLFPNLTRSVFLICNHKNLKVIRRIIIIIRMSRVVDPSDALDSIDIGDGNSAGNHTQQQQQIPSDQKSDKGYLCIGKFYRYILSS